MTRTLVFLVTRNPSLKPAQFRNHYETIHMPLLLNSVGDTFPTTHTRVYIERTENPKLETSISAPEADDEFDSGVLQNTTAEGIDYDAIVTCSFDDEAHVQRYFGRVMDSKEILEDAGKFMVFGRQVSAGVSGVCVTTKDEKRYGSQDESEYWRLG